MECSCSTSCDSYGYNPLLLLARPGHGHSSSCDHDNEATVGQSEGLTNQRPAVITHWPQLARHQVLSPLSTLCLDITAVTVTNLDMNKATSYDRLPLYVETILYEQNTCQKITKPLLSLNKHQGQAHLKFSMGFLYKYSIRKRVLESYRKIKVWNHKESNWQLF